MHSENEKWKEGLVPNQIKRIKNLLNFGCDIKKVHKFKDEETKTEYMRIYYVYKGEEQSTVIGANLKPAHYSYSYEF